MQKALLTVALVSLTALAGCSDAPPSGAFSATDPVADFSVITAVVDATPASNTYPVNDPTGGAGECDLDAITGNIPMFPFACTDATSTVSVDPAGGATLPLVPDSPGYSLFLMRGDAEFGLGRFDHHGEGHYQFEAATFDGQDFSDATAIELRMGDVVVARAPGTGGAFALAQELVMVEADVEYKGREATITVSGPEGVPLVGWFVDVDDETGEKTHSQQVSLAGNVTVFEAPQNIAEYEEFHIHVGASSINVAVAAVE